MDKAFEQELMEAIRRGEEREWATFEPALDNLLIFRASQIKISRRKMLRRIDKCQPKRRKETGYAICRD